jgi:hypothetical protein
VTTDGSKYERLSSFTSYKPRAPFKGVIDLPGTIQAENFDSGADGISYHDADTRNQGGASYRSDAPGVDIESISGGYAVCYTRAGEWLEYTVNVKEAGIYEYDAYISSQDGGGSFSLALSDANGLTDLTGKVSDFGIDIINAYAPEVDGTPTPTAASFQLSGTLGTDYNLVVPKGETWSDMTALAADEMAQFYFTLSSFQTGDLPTWKVVKQVVELVPVPTAP